MTDVEITRRVSTIKLSSSSQANGIPNTTQNSEIIRIKKMLFQLWNNSLGKTGDDSKFKSELLNIFELYANPLEEFLEFLDVSINEKGNNNFAVRVAKELKKWLVKTKSPMVDCEFKPEHNVQLRAFKISSKCSSNEIKTVIFELYKLGSDPELLFLSVPMLKERGWHVQLSQWACLYNVEDKFNLSDYLYPMLLLNSNETFCYLQRHTCKVVDIVKYADSLYKHNEKVIQLFRKLNLPKPDRSTLSVVQCNIGRLLRNCIKSFRLSNELFPNYTREMQIREIMFYYNAFSKNELSEDGFKERIIPLCADDVELQNLLMNILMGKKNTQYMLEFFQNLYGRTLFNEFSKKRPEYYEDYFKVKGFLDMITFVDTDQSADNMLEFVNALASDTNIQEAIPVGLDMEWKSVCTVNVAPPPALLQVAFEKRIFVVDITKMHPNIDFWTELNEKLFLEEKFIKLGYGVGNDQAKLSYYPNLAFISLEGNYYVDLNKEVLKYRKDTVTVKFPYEDEVTESKIGKKIKGLSKTVFLCLSKPLDKRESLSDWEKRPLRSAQLLYAAMDAYCLVQVYHVIKEMHREANLKFSIRGKGSKTNLLKVLDPSQRRTSETNNEVSQTSEERLSNNHRMARHYSNKKKFRYIKKVVESSNQPSVEPLEVSHISEERSSNNLTKVHNRTYRKKRFRYFKKKVEASTQATVESLEASTQT